MDGGPFGLPTSQGAYAAVQKHQWKRLRKLADKFSPARLILDLLIFVVQPILLHEEKAWSSTSSAIYTWLIQIPPTAQHLQLSKQMCLQALRCQWIQQAGSQENPHTETNQLTVLSARTCSFCYGSSEFTFKFITSTLKFNTTPEVLLSPVSEALKQFSFLFIIDTRWF